MKKKECKFLCCTCCCSGSSCEYFEHVVEGCDLEKCRVEKTEFKNVGIYSGMPTTMVELLQL